MTQYSATEINPSDPEFQKALLNADIKHCPICGSPPKLFKCQASSNKGRILEWVIVRCCSNKDVSVLQIVGRGTPFEYTFTNTPVERAIGIWNIRMNKKEN